MPNYDYETLAERGRLANTKLLEGRWEIGWLALQLKAQYGRGIIGEFAKDIGAKRSTVYAYRDVVRFWTNIDPIFQDVEYLKREYPMMRWGHYRLLADKYKDNPMPEVAIVMLAMANEDGETVDALEALFVREDTGETLHSVVTGSAIISAFHGGYLTLDLRAADQVEVEKLRLAQKRGESVRIKIMVQGAEVNA